MDRFSPALKVLCLTCLQDGFWPVARVLDSLSGSVDPKWPCCVLDGLDGDDSRNHSIHPRGIMRRPMRGGPGGGRGRKQPKIDPGREAKAAIQAITSLPPKERPDAKHHLKVNRKIVHLQMPKNFPGNTLSMIYQELSFVGFKISWSCLRIFFWSKNLLITTFTFFNDLLIFSLLMAWMRGVTGLFKRTPSWRKPEPKESTWRHSRRTSSSWEPTNWSTPSACLSRRSRSPMESHTRQTVCSISRWAFKSISSKMDELITFSPTCITNLLHLLCTKLSR